MYQLTISNLDTAFKPLETALSPAQLAAMLKAVAQAAAVTMESVVSPYPRPSGKPLPAIYPRTRKDGSTYLSKFKSNKQQGYVFGVLVAGHKIPYHRTGLLGRSITSEVRDVTPTSATAAVGTNVGYAPYVIGPPGVQNPYFAGNWTPLETDVQTGLPKILSAASDEWQRQLNKQLGGT
jgi:hypothetical protein